MRPRVPVQELARFISLIAAMAACSSSPSPSSSHPVSSAEGSSPPVQPPTTDGDASASAPAEAGRDATGASGLLCDLCEPQGTTGYWCNLGDSSATVNFHAGAGACLADPIQLGPESQSYEFRCDGTIRAPDGSGSQWGSWSIQGTTLTFALTQGTRRSGSCSRR